VSVPGKGDQQFWVADDTEVYGVGTICGDAGSKVDAPCTLDQLEAATQEGCRERRRGDEERRRDPGDGAARRPAGLRVHGFRVLRLVVRSSSDSDSRETVVEGIDEGKGVNGTWFGNVSYLAPGKYTVSDMKGTEQQFLVAEDTKILGLRRHLLG
jgi:hypothetical protein